MPAPAIIDSVLFNAAQEQLRKNRTARLGPRGSQGILCRTCPAAPFAEIHSTARRLAKGKGPPPEGLSLLLVFPGAML